MKRWRLHADIDNYFCTSTISRWYPIFTEPPYFDIITKSLIFCRRNKGLRVHAYVIMPNHLHLIISCNKTTSLSEIMRDFKRHTSRRLSSLLQQNNRQKALNIFEKAAKNVSQSRNYKIWQNGFRPIGLYSSYFYRQKLNYLHNNPVQKGYVIRPEGWFYSSARNYAGCTNVAMPIDCLA